MADDLDWIQDCLPLMQCPVSGQPLRWASEAERNAAGLQAGSQALASEDGARVYPIQDGIPVLLPPEQSAGQE